MNFLEDPLTGQTRSIQKCRDSLRIPMDLIIEIFSRLPAKSAARCICLSKFWANLIRSQCFVDLFSANSSARPQILFGRRNRPKFSFFSADQSSENSSDIIAPTHVTHYPISNDRCLLGVPINGLVCLSEYLGEMMLPVIHNPTTGEFLTLPKIKTRWRRQDLYMRYFLGYDPIGKHFKVLSLEFNIKVCDVNNIFMEYQVLTLETKKLSWRTIQCCTPHLTQSCPSEICIDGILYYPAVGVSAAQLIVCFDVRSEKFKFINVIETFNKKFPVTTVLTNYNGKLGLLSPKESGRLLTGESRSFELWVLKDAEKKEWWNRVFVLPPVWKKVVTETELNFLVPIGMIGTNKIVLSSSFLTNEAPYIFSYDIRKNTIRRINIRGMEASTHIYVYAFLNHVENVISLKEIM